MIDPRLKIRLFLLLAMTVPVLVVLLAVPIFPQPLWYHDFADQRSLLGIPHMLNVVSNIPFVVVGAWGIWHLARTRGMTGFRDPAERWPYVVFFAAIALTGVGSAYYHGQPNNDRLLWDRLPLAMAFMGLFAIIIGERLDRRATAWLFVPLVLLGGGSVVYWHATEVWGRGDLRPYLLVQLYPLLLVPVILLLCAPRYTRGSDLYGALAWYATAKVLELLDRQVYSQAQIVSGHTLKHLVAAGSAYLILHMIQRRHPLPEPTLNSSGNYGGNRCA